jgi:hypothetical protein
MTDFYSAVEAFFYAAARGGAQHPEECLSLWQENRHIETVEAVNRVIRLCFDCLPLEIRSSNTARFISFTFPGNEIARFESCEGTVVTLQYGKAWSGEKEIHLTVNGHENSVRGRINAIPDSLIPRTCPEFGGAFECEPNCPKCEKEKVKEEKRTGTPVIPPVAPPSSVS